MDDGRSPHDRSVPRCPATDDRTDIEALHLIGHPYARKGEPVATLRITFKVPSQGTRREAESVDFYDGGVVTGTTVEELPRLGYDPHRKKQQYGTAHANLEVSRLLALLITKHQVAEAGSQSDATGGKPKDVRASTPELTCLGFGRTTIIRDACLEKECYSDIVYISSEAGPARHRVSRKLNYYRIKTGINAAVTPGLENLEDVRKWPQVGSETKTVARFRRLLPSRQALRKGAASPDEMRRSGILRGAVVGLAEQYIHEVPEGRREAGVVIELQELESHAHAEGTLDGFAPLSPIAGEYLQKRLEHVSSPSKFLCLWGAIVALCLWGAIVALWKGLRRPFGWLRASSEPRVASATRSDPAGQAAPGAHAGGVGQIAVSASAGIALVLGIVVLIIRLCSRSDDEQTTVETKGGEAGQSSIISARGSRVRATPRVSTDPQGRPEGSSRGTSPQVEATGGPMVLDRSAGARGQSQEPRHADSSNDPAWSFRGGELALSEKRTVREFFLDPVSRSGALLYDYLPDYPGLLKGGRGGKCWWWRAGSDVVGECQGDFGPELTPDVPNRYFVGTVLAQYPECASGNTWGRTAGGKELALGTWGLFASIEETVAILRRHVFLAVIPGDQYWPEWLAQDATSIREHVCGGGWGARPCSKEWTLVPPGSFGISISEATGLPCPALVRDTDPSGYYRSSRFKEDAVRSWERAKVELGLSTDAGH